MIDYHYYHLLNYVLLLLSCPQGSIKKLCSFADDISARVKKRHHIYILEHKRGRCHREFQHFYIKQKQILFTMAFKFKHSYMRPETWSKCFHVTIFLLISVENVSIFSVTLVKLNCYICFILYILPFAQNIVTDKPSRHEISKYQTTFNHI